MYYWIIVQQSHELSNVIRGHIYAIEFVFGTEWFIKNWMNAVICGEYVCTFLNWICNLSFFMHGSHYRVDCFQEQRLHEANSSPTFAAKGPPAVMTNNNPFGSPTQPVATMDAFGAPPAAGKPSNDLLNLNSNPFVDSVQSVMSMNNTVNTMSSPGEPTWQANGKMCWLIWFFSQKVIF